MKKNFMMVKEMEKVQNNEDGDILFEGEYLNGKKWKGKGKDFNYDGNLEFEGIYVYGYKYNGKAYANHRLEFEGEYLFDKKWNRI